MRPASRRALRRLGLRLLDRRAGRPGRPDLSRHRAHRRRALRGGGPARAHGPAVLPAPRPKPDHTLEVRRILDGCRPLAGSPAETYLRSRGLSDPGSPDLLYHPDLTDYDGARGWPGMVAVPRMRRRLAGRRHPPDLPARRRLGARRRRARRCWGRWRTVRCGCSRSVTTVISASPKASRPRSPRRRSSGSRSGPRSPPTAWRAGSGRPTSGASPSSPTPARQAARPPRGSPSASPPRAFRTRSWRRSMATTSTTTCSAAPSRRTMDARRTRPTPRRRRRPLPASRAPARSAPSWKPRPRR